MSSRNAKRLIKGIPTQWRKRSAWACAAFLVYSLCGFLLVPALFKWQMLKQLPAVTKRNVKVAQVRVNPWTLSLTIRGLELNEGDGTRFASWDELYVNFQSSSLFGWMWTFKEIKLTGPYGSVILQKDGNFNFANLVPAPERAPRPEKASSDVPRMRVFELTITNGFVGFQDQTRKKPFITEYKPINVRLMDLQTRPGASTPYSFRAENDSGKTLTWAGDITVQPFQSHGHIAVEKADPKKYQPYLDDYARIEVTDGTVGVQADYYLSTGTNGVDLVASNAVLTVQNLRIRDPGASEQVLSLGQLLVEGGEMNLRERNASAGLVRVSKLETVTRLDGERNLNLMGLLVPRPATGPAPLVRGSQPTSAPPWTVALKRFELEEGAISFEDLGTAVPFKTRFAPITIVAENLSNRTNTDGSFRVEIATESKEAIALGGIVALNPPRVTGGLKVASVHLPKYLPYIQPFFTGGIQSGTADTTVEYSCALGTGQGSVSAVITNGAVKVSELRISAADTNVVPLYIPEFGVEGAEASLVAKHAGIRKASLVGASVDLVRETNGTLNILNLLRQTGRARAEEQKPAQTEWVAEVKEVSITNCAVKALDKLAGETKPIVVGGISVNLKGLSSRTNTPLDLVLALMINEQGSVKLEGKGCLVPPSADLQVAVRSLDLRPIQPYLQPYAQVQLTGGALSFGGLLNWHPGETQAPQVKVKGDLNVADFSTLDQLVYQHLVSWTNFVVRGIDAAFPPAAVSAEAVDWVGFKTSVVITTNRELAITSVLPKSGARAPASAPAAGSTPNSSAQGDASGHFPLAFKLGSFNLQNASLAFADGSIEPNCRFDLRELSGSIQNLSSDSNATAQVDMHGRFDEQSRFTMTGSLRPLAKDLFCNITFSNQNVQLPAFTPYMEKFAGYPLNKGRLSMAMSYDVKGRAVKGENRFVIDQLLLGARNESPDATKLPVKLAIALLKDKNGKIDLDVPISGSLDDPEFRIAPLVWKVVMNMVVKAATSPFKLLGALVGGGEELSFIAFEPGTANLLSTETNKVSKLIQALRERPALNVEIAASADPTLDKLGLGRQIVREQIRAARLKELTAKGKSSTAPQDFVLEPGDYERLLRAELARQFGTNLSKALADYTAATSNAVVSAAERASKEPAPKRGLLVRMVQWVPLMPGSGVAAQSRRQAHADAALLKQNPELGSLQVEDMENLLAMKCDVPAELFRGLIEGRCKAVQAELLKESGIQQERVFLTAPSSAGAPADGSARATLSLN